MYGFFFNSDRKGFVLSGVAGSGKTEIIIQLCQQLYFCKDRFVVVSLTNRAISRLYNKMTSMGHVTSTLHALLYMPITDVHGRVTHFAKRSKTKLQNNFQFIIVDEASMVGEEMFKDLMDLEIPILFVGDSEQLPPIPNTSFNVMDRPDFSLTEIHRQAERNPIIALSRIIRETGEINTSTLNETICALPKHEITKSFLQNNHFDIILTGINRERIKLNKLMRIAKGYFEGFPGKDEQIISLKNKVFTFGYAMTVWKARGNEFDGVLFYDEDTSQFTDRRRFRYTAVTRAKKRLTIAY